MLRTTFCYPELINILGELEFSLHVIYQIQYMNSDFTLSIACTEGD